MTDLFQGTSDNPAAPARQAFTIIPHDTNQIVPLPKSIICCTAGNITLRAIDSQMPVTIPVAAGQQLDIRATLVMATGTTVTNIIGLA